MAQKILLIDNDEHTFQLFMQVAAALNIEYLIMHNWGRSVHLPEKKNIKAVFVNVELNFIDLQLIWKEFMPKDAEIKIPIFFLFSRTFCKSYQAAKRLPHNGELKKPLKAEELFEALNSCINLETLIDYPEEKFKDKIKDFRAYLSATRVLINKLETYFE